MNNTSKQKQSTTVIVHPVVVPQQLHAGDSTLKPGSTLWHTDHEGLYWSGHHHHRTPRQLLDEFQSTIRDIYRNHPELVINPVE